MKYLTHLLRLFLGITFIISGMIKLNDPMGFSFKLEDYFAPNVLGLPSLIPFALTFAIIVCIVEVVLGVMLLVGYQKKLTLWSLLAMLIFFGFLTFYSAYFNKVTDCGCFGDAIKFTPWQSFTKDIVLLVAALIIFLWGQDYIKPISKGKLPLYITLLSVIFCSIFVYYVYNHLPIKDFRPYKIGTSIPEGMKIPSGKITYYWTVKIDGKEQKIINNGQVPKDKNGNYAEVLNVKTEVPEAPIHDFYIWDKEGENYFDDYIWKDKLLLVVSYRLDRANEEAFKKIKRVTDEALKGGYTVIGLTSQLDKAPYIVKKYELNFDFYYNDATTLKTIIRSNPGLVKVSKGVIKGKKHYNDATDLKLAE